MVSKHQITRLLYDYGCGGDNILSPRFIEQLDNDFTEVGQRDMLADYLTEEINKLLQESE